MKTSTFRCGALHCGDQINAIDQKSFDGISLNEANQILRSCTGDFCRIEVTPATTLNISNSMFESSIESSMPSSSSSSSNSRAMFNESNRQAFYRTPLNHPMQTNPMNNNWTMRNNYQSPAKKSINKMRHNSISKLTLTFYFVIIS